MRTSRSLITAAMAALAALALFGGAVAAQEDDSAEDPQPTAPSAASAEDLIDRLVDLVTQADADVLAAFETDPTTDDLVGDYVGLSVRLEDLSDEFRSLFQDADESAGTTAAAVADAARAHLQVESAVDYFARVEDFDLDRSLATVDANGVATGADPAIGLLNVGLELYEDAVLRAFQAFGVLIDAPEADDQERTFFEDQFAQTIEILDEEIPAARVLLGERTTAVLYPRDRFDAGPDAARARAAQYVCIDRSVYGGQPGAPVVDADGVPYGEPFEAADCPDLPVSDEAGLENVVTVAP